MSRPLSAHTPWLTLAALGSCALLACSSSTPNSSGSAGATNSESGARNQSGGAPNAGAGNGAGSPSTAGAMSVAGSASGGGGTGGASAGAAGVTVTGGAPGAGAGGAGGGTIGAAGAAGMGGGAAVPTAVANIMGENGQNVTGTATFTQGATMTKLVLDLTACPNGAHSSHLHENKDCGMNGDKAGGHWMPNGINLGDYVCANNKVTYEMSKPISAWTVGGAAATDVTQHAFMVHEMGDANSGNRIGCGLINKQ